MRILILPSTCIPDVGSSIQIARNLAALFHLEGIECAVGADKKSKFSDVSFFPTPSVSRLRRSFRKASVYEEYLYYSGALSSSFLAADYQAILSVIHEFKPDCVFEIERPAGIIASSDCHIPVFSIVSPGAFRERDFRVESLNGINEFLRQSSHEQILRLYELYRTTRCISFGPEEFQFYYPDYPVTPIGLSCIEPILQNRENQLSIVISQSSLTMRKCRQIIESTFLGAPYNVYIHGRRMKQGTKENLHFLSPSRLSSVNGTKICIHDGTDAITNYCIALGIPQVLIYDSSHQRLCNAGCLRKTGAGLAVAEDDLSVGSVYEAYRMIAADDQFAMHAEALRQRALAFGDLSTVLSLLPEKQEN